MNIFCPHGVCKLREVQCIYSRHRYRLSNQNWCLEICRKGIVMARSGCFEMEAELDRGLFQRQYLEE